MNKIIFSGLMILACCLFGGVGIVNGETDIAGQCVEISIPTGGKVTPADICQARGYMTCERVVSGVLLLFTSDDCSASLGVGIDYNHYSINNCNNEITTSLDINSAKMWHLGGGVLACGGRGWGNLTPPKNVPEDFGGAVANATNWLLGFVSMLAVLMIIWGGINYLTAAGDEDKARTAKKIITYGLTGVVIAGLAYAMVTVIVTVILK